MEFSRGMLLKIEDFFRGGVKKMEFFGGEALISTKFFRGKPIFFRVYNVRSPKDDFQKR